MSHTSQATRTRAEPGHRWPVDRLARWAILIYLDLWILEGAFRKWVPGLGDLGYVARDAFALLALLVFAMYPRSRGRSSGWLWAFLLFFLVLGAVQVIADLISFPMMIVGLRSYIAPALLPALVWRFPSALSLAQFSRRIMLHLPLQAAIVVLQVLSPPNAPINWQVGTEMAGFINFGVVRATGTFSAVSGLGAYLGIVVAVALVQVLSPDGRRARWAALITALGLMCGVLGGDRSSLITLLSTVAVFVLSVLLANPIVRGRSAAARIVPLVALLGAVSAVVAAGFSSVLESFSRRIENAAQAEDPVERTVRQAFQFTGIPSLQPSGHAGFEFSILGDGLASHSQAGIALGATGQWVEIEATRWVAELGVFGWALGMARVLACVILVFVAVAYLRRKNPAVAVFSFVLISVALPGLITQTPSTQASFGVMVALVLLALRRVAAGDEQRADPDGRRSPVATSGTRS